MGVTAWMMASVLRRQMCAGRSEKVSHQHRRRQNEANDALALAKPSSTEHTSTKPSSTEHTST
jgi:hypothetical protein